MIAVVKLYIEGIRFPFCEINMNRTTKRQLDTAIYNARDWLAIVTEQAGTPMKDMACERCDDVISILKYVLKAKNINAFAQEKAVINELIGQFEELQGRIKL